MQILKNTYITMNRTILNQQYDSTKKYKWLKYIYTLNYNNEYIIYNLWTGEIILLTNKQYNQPSQQIQKMLVECWYKIPIEVDDYSLYYLSMQELNKRFPKKRFNKIKTCTLLTTTACNAQCYYCYEKGIKTEFMTKQVVDDLIKFFISDKVQSYLNLRWFGGEPLLNTKIIDYMCKQLKENHIQYESLFLSNGYLVKNLSKQDLQRWNVKTFQITIDGYKEVYNTIKNYKNINQNEDPFTTLINNIQFLLKNHIKVTIRMNLDYNNVKQQKELVDFLIKKFSKNISNFSIYSSPIYDLINFNSSNNNKNDRKKIFENYKEMINYINKKKLFPREVKRTHCMADDGVSIVVAPNGYISTCEHHPYDGYYTQNINKIPYNLEEINKWAEKTPLKEECKVCFYKPLCNTLKKCQLDFWCDEYSIDFRKFEIERSLKEYYQQRKKQKEWEENINGKYVIDSRKNKTIDHWTIEL